MGLLYTHTHTHTHKSERGIMLRCLFGFCIQYIPHMGVASTH